MEPELLKQDIGDAEIEYLHYPGNGKPIILLHATGFLPWLWHPIAEKLAGTYRVIAPYFCDHREGEPEKGGIRWHVLAEDLCRLCSGLELEAPMMVGHSMGATVITLASVQGGQKVNRMVLIEPIFLPQQVYSMNITVEQHPLAAKSIKRRNYWEDENELREYLKSKPLFSVWDDEILELYIQYGIISGDTGGFQLACHPRREAALFMGSIHTDPWPLLPEIECPVLVVEGEKSENRQFIDLEKAVSLMPQGQYSMVNKAGHLIPMEQPATITELLRKFFKGENPNSSVPA